ncbi:hypothetical protein [Cytobacillus praedii]|uniref:hypothetical protein n=1 Tax=Cytobacillus praedii TaxID=1742358 RepID=UPI002E1EE057|nr:hypothetical protein [Cytobacillus praedii]
MQLYKAKLKTGGKTPEQILATYEGPDQIGPKPDDKEVQAWIKVFNDLDGIEVLVLKSFTGEDWALASWMADDDEKVMEFVYLAEQDPYFGSYVDERKEFINDWKSEEYEPAGALVFAVTDVEIIEELKKEKTTH